MQPNRLEENAIHKKKISPERVGEDNTFFIPKNMLITVINQSRHSWIHFEKSKNKLWTSKQLHWPSLSIKKLKNHENAWNNMKILKNLRNHLCFSLKRPSRLLLLRFLVGAIHSLYFIKWSLLKGSKQLRLRPLFLSWHTVVLKTSKNVERTEFRAFRK